MSARRDPARWIAFVVLSTACGGARHDGRSASAAQTAEEWFTERAAATGLEFTHFNGASGQFYYPEILPPGVALFDFDNDGDLDVLVIQGRMLGNRPISAATYPPADPSGPGVRLYRNDLAVGAGGARTLRFTDVTARSGIDA